MKIADIENGRNNLDSSIYTLFCEKYVPCVMGKIKFKTHCYAKMLKDYCTVSDEAMAMLVYSNNFDQWLHKSRILYKSKLEAEKKEKENDKSNTDEIEDPTTDPFYIKYNIDKCNLEEEPPQKYFLCKKGRGHTYSQQGYIYFNEMCSNINTDRHSNGEKFDEDFLKHMNDIIENSRNQKKGMRKKAIEEETVVRAYVEGEPGRGAIPLNTRLEYINVPKTSV